MSELSRLYRKSVIIKTYDGEFYNGKVKSVSDENYIIIVDDASNEIWIRWEDIMIIQTHSNSEKKKVVYVDTVKKYDASEEI